MGDKPHTLDRTLSAPISWKEMFQTVSVSSSRLPSEPRTCKAGHSQKCGSDRKSELEKGSPRTMDSNRLKAMNFQLALYIAMAHAGLLLLILTLYGLSLLLRDFWKPIQWAVLCSITLREIQASLVRFWEAPLRKGLVQTAVAVPVAIFEGLVLTFHDAHVTLMWIVGKAPDGPVKVGFLKLLQWLVAFGVLTVGYEVLGPKSLATAVFTGLLAYAGFSVLTGDQGEVVSRQGRRRSSVTMKCLGWACWPAVGVFKVVNKRATRFVSKRLPTIIAVGLIVIMLLGSVAGMVIFTYKAGFETKDAIVALKDHVQQTNYTEMIGLKNWLENTNVPSLIEQHASTAYETVSYHIDLFGINYNLTEFTDAGKEYIISFARGKPNAISSNSSMDVSSHPVVIRLQNAKRLLQENEIYSELDVT